MRGRRRRRNSPEASYQTSGDIFQYAAHHLTSVDPGLLVRMDNRRLAMRCLSLASVVCGYMVAPQPDSDLGKRFTAIAFERDADAAGRAVFALAWYFAFRRAVDPGDATRRRQWVDEMSRALGPIDSVRVVTVDDITSVYADWWNDGDERTKFTSSYYELVARQLGIHSNPDPFEHLALRGFLQDFASKVDT